MKTRLRPALIVSLTGLLSCAVLPASTGEFSELKLPADVSGNAVKVTETYTLVRNAGASYGGKSAVGEVLVFSNSSGKLLRRLRSKNPYPTSHFGRLVTAQGHVAYVTEGSSFVHAIDLTSGKLLWTTTTESGPGSALPGKSVQIGSLAVEGDRLYLGLPEAWLLDYPALNFFAYEGMTMALNVRNGNFISHTNTSTDQEGMAQYGQAIAVGGGYFAVGAPGYDDEKSGAPISNQGMVVVSHQSGWRGRLLSPAPSAQQAFGQSVAISGFSLYVGSSNGNAVRHYDLRNLGLIETINAPGGSAQFGAQLSASGHLLLIGDNNGAWLYDRLAKTLVRIFEDSKTLAGPVKTGFSLCGPLAAGPASGRVFRCRDVGGGRFAGTQVMAATGGAAPNAGAGKFAAFGEMAITDTGVMAHASRLKGGTAANDSGLWSTLGGAHELVLREGDMMGSKRMGTPFRPFFATGGHGRFLVRQSTGALAVCMDDGASVSPVLLEGGVVGMPGQVTAPFVSRIREAAATMGNSTLINFTLRTGAGIHAGNDSVIARPALISTVEAREGAASGVSGLTYGQISPRLASTTTRHACAAALLEQPAAVNAAVFSKAPGMSPPLVLAQKGGAAHHLANHFTEPKFSSFVGEAVSAGGTVYRAKFTSGKITREGLWIHNHMDGDVLPHTAPVAWVDGQAVGMAAGVKYRRFLRTFITTGGEVVFMAQVKGPGITAGNDVGVWRRLSAGGQIIPLIREGDAVPCADGAVIGTIQRLEVADGGRWMLLASLARCPAGRNQVLFVGNVAGHVVPEILQRKGDVVDRSAPSRLLSLGMSTNNSDAAGMGSKGGARLAGASHVLYSARFSNGTELVRSTVFGN